MTTPPPTDTGHRDAGAMLLMGACYPLLAHVAVLQRSAALVAASVGLLVVLILYRGLRRGHALAWILLLAAALGLYAAAGRDGALQLLFLPPVLVNGFMAWVFGHTLRSGHVPLIERVVRAMHGPQDPLTPAIIAYARHVTLAWAAVLALLAAVNLLLAAVARPGGLLLAAGLDPGISVPLGVWSLFANVLNYALVAALFVVEYLVRRRRFPEQPYRGFVDFTRRLAGLRGMFRPAPAAFGLQAGAGSRKH